MLQRALVACGFRSKDPQEVALCRLVAQLRTCMQNAVDSTSASPIAAIESFAVGFQIFYSRGLKNPLINSRTEFARLRQLCEQVVDEVQSGKVLYINLITKTFNRERDITLRPGDQAAPIPLSRFRGALMSLGGEINLRDVAAGRARSFLKKYASPMLVLLNGPLKGYK